MKSRVSILLFEFDSLTYADLEKLNHIFISFDYKEEIGYGFNNIDYHFDYLSASIITKNPVYISEYDEFQNKLTRKTIFVYSEVKFAFDAKYNLLEIYAPLRDSSRVISLIQNIFFVGHSLTQVDLSPHRIIPKLASNFKNVEVTKAIVTNYCIADKARGNFLINKASSDFIEDLLIEYTDCIRKISLSADIDDSEKAEISFSANGQITIKSNEPEDVLNLIKLVLFKR